MKNTSNMALEPEHFEYKCQFMNNPRRGSDENIQGDICGNYFRGRSGRSCIVLDHVSKNREGE